MTTVWETTVAGVDRIRGASYYDGNVYVTGNLADPGPGGEDWGAWQIDASDGSSSLLFSMALGTHLMQAVRFDDVIYSVSRDHNLYRHRFDGSDWVHVTTNDLGKNDLYGIGMHSSGNYIWVSSTGREVSFFSVPEPSSLLLLALSSLLLWRRRRVRKM